MQVSSFVRQFMTYFLYIKFDFILVNEKCCLFTKYLNETGVLFVALSHLYVQHVIGANRKNANRII